jgi:predicted alpha/beta hydrolase family esterase
VAFLLLHGLDGSGPDHWQTWLAGRLEERGLEVAYPNLPDASAPRIGPWLAALDDALGGLPADTTVLCHSLGCLLWLHHAARRPPSGVARALLVAPTQPDDEDLPSVGFRPTPLDAAGIAAAARETLLVCSTDDPYCPPPTSRRIAATIDAEIDWVDGGGHLNTAAGLGPWPELESWALGERARPV